MSKRTETRWVIVGNAGLYTGQWLTRRDAIEAHAGHYYAQWPGQPRAEWIADQWKRRRKNGDRCVKATITWTEP
jgi:hypothetical protein